MASDPESDSPVSVEGVIWSLVALSALFLCLRLYCKHRGRGLRWDDLVLFASWVALLSNCVIMTIIFSMATAEETSPISVDTINTIVTLGMCSTTVAIVSQSWSKTSFAITLLSTSEGWMWAFLLLTIVTMNILFGLGALFFWIGCSPLEKAWHPLVPGTCWDPSFNVVFGIVVSGYSGVMDLVFAMIPWKIIMPLNMNPREKLGCVVAMSMGIFAGMAAFIKCTKLPSISPGSSQDPMQLAIWGVAEPAVTIMAASIPAMRLLVRKITAPKPEFLDEEEVNYVPRFRGHSLDSGSRLSTWVSSIASWSSTVVSLVTRRVYWDSSVTTRERQEETVPASPGFRSFEGRAKLDSAA